MLVYLATNLVNGKKYIGYTTKTLKKRINVHIYKSKCKSNKHYFYLFKEALRKHGAENFKWEILEECSTKEECCKKEIFYISKHNTISPNGYNLTEGGNGGLQSEETRLKISESVKKYFENNRESNSFIKATKEDRSNWAKKSWEIKKKKGYISPSYFHKEESKIQMSLTKNKLNKLKWMNIYTSEITDLSLTDMAKKTGLSVGVFNHLKQGRQSQTKCGWIIIKEGR
jgi:group I intron endonuclease